MAGGQVLGCIRHIPNRLVDIAHTNLSGPPGAPMLLDAVADGHMGHDALSAGEAFAVGALPLHPDSAKNRAPRGDNDAYDDCNRLEHAEGFSPLNCTD